MIKIYIRQRYKEEEGSGVCGGEPHTKGRTTVRRKRFVPVSKKTMMRGNKVAVIVFSNIGPSLFSSWIHPLLLWLA